MGIRSPSLEVDEAVRVLLAPHVVDDPDSPPNFSLALAKRQGGDRRRKLHVLYKGDTSIARSRGGPKLGLALTSALGALLPPSAADGLIGLGALVVVRDAAALLLAPTLVESITALEPSLSRSGIRVALGTIHRLDTRTAEVVTDPAIAWKPDGLDTLERLHPTPAGERTPAAFGRYPVVGWGLSRQDAGSNGIGKCAALTLAARHVRGWRALDGNQALDELARMIEQIDAFSVTSQAGPLEKEIFRRLGT